MDVLKTVRTSIDEPRNRSVAKPADKPKTNNCFLVKEYSIDLAANTPVQKTIVNGLDMVNINAEIKLVKMVCDWLIIVKSVLIIFAVLIAIYNPNNIRITELTSPNISLVFSFSKILPTPAIASNMYR